MDDSRRLLQGEVVEPCDEKVLGEAVKRLEQLITDRKRELKQLEGMIAVTAAKLRTLHLALTAFFGSSSAPASVATADTGVDANMPHDVTKWNVWKQIFPEPTGRIIDALIIQPLTATQLAMQAKMHPNKVSKYMTPLKNNELVEKDGSKWRLKRL